MNTSKPLLIFMSLTACTSSGFAATISGSVKGPEGALEGVVQAQNNKTHMTYMVLSDSLGTYHLQNLPSGDYKLSTKITGYQGDPRSDVKLAADQKAAFDRPRRSATERNIH